MKDVRFLYRDEGTNGEWREREGRFRDVAQAIEWYGLGEDCDYRMVAVFDHDKGSYEWTWLDDVEDLSGCVPLCKLPEVDPFDPEPAEAARAAATMAVEEVLDAASAISPLIARLRYVDPANAGRPDEYRLVSADPEVQDAHGGMCHASVGDLVESSCDLKNGITAGEVCGAAIELEACGQGYELPDGTRHNVVRQVQLRQMDPIWAHQFRHDFLVPKIDFMFGQVGQVFPMPGVVEECRKSAVAARDRALREFAEAEYRNVWAGHEEGTNPFEYMLGRDDHEGKAARRASPQEAATAAKRAAAVSVGCGGSTEAIRH